MALGEKPEKLAGVAATIVNMALPLLFINCNGEVIGLVSAAGFMFAEGALHGVGRPGVGTVRSPLSGSVLADDLENGKAGGGHLAPLHRGGLRDLAASD